MWKHINLRGNVCNCQEDYRRFRDPFAKLSENHEIQVPRRPQIRNSWSLGEPGRSGKQKSATIFIRMPCFERPKLNSLEDFRFLLKMGIDSEQDIKRFGTRLHPR